MTIPRDVLAELRKMFLADTRLSRSVLALVGVAALATHLPVLPMLAAGLILTLGCPALLIAAIRAEAARKRRS